MSCCFVIYERSAVIGGFLVVFCCSSVHVLVHVLWECGLVKAVHLSLLAAAKVYGCNASEAISYELLFSV